MPLMLPRRLLASLWEHVERELPSECVGVLGGRDVGLGTAVEALYPLRNVARQPERRYLADPAGLLRALRAMERGGLTLAAIYHSHPHGPARPSLTDLALAGYPVPYLIADVPRRELRAFLLPGGRELDILMVGEDAPEGHPAQS